MQNPKLATKKSYLWLDELSTTEAKQASTKSTVIILPIGSVEEHGDHLPLGTDSIQPEYIAEEVAKKTSALIAPPIRYGICNSARNFPGTLSITFGTLYRLTKDILAELVRNDFTKIIILSGHAGQSHMVALRQAAQSIVMQNQETVRIMVLSDYDFVDDLKGKYAQTDDGHAGTIETSRIMSIKPNLIKGKGKKSQPNMPRFEVVAHPEKYFPNGVHGDPTTATAQKGNEVNAYIIEQMTKLVNELKTN
jgi:creatinine amidohydrolase